MCQLYGSLGSVSQSVSQPGAGMVRFEHCNFPHSVGNYSAMPRLYQFTPYTQVCKFISNKLLAKMFPFRVTPSAQSCMEDVARLSLNKLLRNIPS